LRVSCFSLGLLLISSPDVCFSFFTFRFFIGFLFNN
jgi:hypothetical protein